MDGPLLGTAPESPDFSCLPQGPQSEQDSLPPPRPLQLLPVHPACPPPAPWLPSNLTDAALPHKPPQDTITRAQLLLIYNSHLSGILCSIWQPPRGLGPSHPGHPHSGGCPVPQLSGPRPWVGGAVGW